MPVKRKTTKNTKRIWFIAVRGSYLPRSWPAWLSYIPFTAYLIFTLVDGWQNTTSPAQAVLFIVPNWFAATVIMTYFAKRTS